MREIEENRLEGRRGHDHLATAIAAANTSSQELMQQILTRLNQVPSGYMSQSAQQMLQTSQVSPGYMTQPAQEKADTVMAPPPTLKRLSSELGASESKGGRGTGKGKGFQIRVIGQKHDGIVTNTMIDVTLGMTLEQLKAVLLEPISNDYQFERGFYRGQNEVMSDQITMQEMNMESGSTLIIFFPYPEGVERVRPLSDIENSLSMKCANTPTKASFIGQLGISSHMETHSPTISLVAAYRVLCTVPSTVQTVHTGT